MVKGKIQTRRYLASSNSYNARKLCTIYTRRFDGKLNLFNNLLASWKMLRTFNLLQAKNPNRALKFHISNSSAHNKTSTKFGFN